jgi:ferredoxin/flavodoxin---NADP+ reductase
MTNALIPNATLVERIDVAPSLAIFRVRPDVIPAASEPWFVPGQYVTLGLGELQRAYSIASEPGERRWLEFYIRYARNPETETPLTHRLWELAAGGRVNVGEKIVGRFTLDRTGGPGDEREKLLVAAGTGIAPFISMVRAAVRAGDAATIGRMIVCHGVSHPFELAYRDELEDAAARFGLRYRPTVSRAAEHPDWAGATGRVERLFMEGAATNVEAGLGLAPGALHPERIVAYVCGFRGTIAETVRALLRRGFVPEERRLRRVLGFAEDRKPSLFFEQYDLTPVFDSNDTALIASLRADIHGA